MSESIELIIDVDVLRRELAEVNQEVNDTEEKAGRVIEEVENRSREAFNDVLSIARSSYIIALGTVKAMGGSVSYMFRSMVSAAFTTIHALQALALGKAMTTSDWLSFTMEMAQLGLALGATIAADLGQQEIGRSLMGAKMSLMGLQNLIGVMSY